MAKSNIVIRNLTTGAGQPGLTVVLKKYNGTTFENFQQAQELSGLPGVYSFTDIPYARYKLFINDTEDTTWDNSSTDGRFFGGRISEVITDLDMTNHKAFNLLPGESPNDAVVKSQLDTKLDKTGDTFLGDMNANSKRISNLPMQDENTEPSDAARVGLIMGVNSFIAQNYLNIQNNTIIVDSQITNVILGKKYNKIQDAINYAQTQSPSLNNKFNILIFPHKVNSGYIENITLQPHVNLYGIGKIIITGTLTGGNANTRIKNIMFSYHGNLSLNSVHADSCTFRVTNDDTGNILTITSCILNACSLINLGQAEFNPTITSGGGNIFLNCLSNISCNLQSTDKGFINSLESVTTDFS